MLFVLLRGYQFASLISFSLTQSVLVFDKATDK